MSIHEISGNDVPGRAAGSPPDVLIVHLTDIHITDANHPILARSESIANAVGSVIEESTHVLLLISGDIAQSGEPDEYVVARKFLSEIQTHINKWHPITLNIAVAPGNHDCNHTKSKTIVRRSVVAATKASTSDISDLINELNLVQADFLAFRDQVTPECHNISPLQTQKLFQLDDYRIHVELLNTAWCSIRDEDKIGQLTFPVDKLSAPGDAHLVIAAAHHPTPWFTPSDRRSLERWLDTNVDIVLTGHEHDHDDFIRLRAGRESCSGGARIVIGNALYTKEHGATLGFKCLQLDRANGRVRTISFEQQQRNNHYAKKIETDWVQFAPNELRRLGRTKPTAEFEAFLNSLDLNFTHPLASRKLKLDDLLVLPNLKVVNVENTDFGNFGDVVSGPDICAELLSQGRTLIVGGEQSGKTTLAKVFFRHAIDLGYVPIYLDAADVKSKNKGDITAWIYAAYRAQYGEELQTVVEQLPPEKRIVIVDNLESSPAGTEGVARIVQRIETLATRYVLLSSENPIISATLERALDRTAPNFLHDVSSYQLLPLNNSLRGELIRKWVVLGREDTEDSNKLIYESRRVKDYLDSAIRKNGFPKHPINILLLLQSWESVREASGVIHSGSHGFLFERLIIDSFEAARLKSSVGTTFSYLCAFARLLTDQNSSTVDQATFEEFYSLRQSANFMDVDIEDFLSDLIRIDVLFNDDRGIGFKHRYYYYYFLAREMSEKLDDDATILLLDRLVEFVHTERSSNVLTFLAHFRKERWVLERLLKKASNLYEEGGQSKLADRNALLLRFRTHKDQRILLDGPALRVSEHKEAQEDAHDEMEGALKMESEELDDPLQINSALKTVQVLGQILKSRAADIDGPRKIEIGLSILTLSRRTLEAMCRPLDLAADDVVRLLSNAFATTLKVNKERAVTIANQVFATFVVAIAIVCYGRASGALASSELDALRKQLGGDRSDFDAQLILLCSHLQVVEVFPADMVRALAANNQTSELSLAVLQQSTARRFFLNPPAKQVVRSICDTLNIKIKLLPHSEE